MADPTLHFLPWLRRGLAGGIGTVDSGQTSLPRVARLAPTVEVDGVPATASLALRPADHAAAISLAQIVRRFPQPGVTDAEYGYFPLVELLAPDLPWALTPAVAGDVGADATSRLRPWLVLVCVPADAGEYVAAEPSRPARLLVSAEQLPDPAETHAWAHVQSTIDPSAIATEIGQAAPGAVIARLVCPRRLEPMTRYRAAVVAAFRRDATGNSLTPAWEAGTAGTVDLTVFDTWTFTTGDVPSFEELCRRLGPVADDSLVFGVNRLDVTELGTIDPWPDRDRPVVVDYSGALVDDGVRLAVLGPLKESFDTAVTAVLDQARTRVELDPDDPDPVVTPPFYGAYATGTTAVPATPGWIRQVNLVPNRRAAAGLGAEIVRTHQERFMAQAWDQTGALRETNRELSVGRLQAEMGRTWRHRAMRLDPMTRVAVLRSQLTFVRDPEGAAPRRILADSTIPAGLISPAYVRLTRPGAVVAAAAARRGLDRDTEPQAGTPRWQRSVARTFGSADRRRALDFAAVGIPDGTGLDDPRRGPVPVEVPPQRFDDVELADVAATAAAIDPVTTVRTRLSSRIGALGPMFGGLPDGELPTRVAWGPRIDEALVWLLAERSPELLLPGIGSFPYNAVRLVTADSAFAAAFLTGANHEMERELLWREFPADLSSTTFRRFWDRPDRTACDITPMAGWLPDQTLDELGAAGGESVVVLVRGDLVRQYPAVRILLNDSTTDSAKLPSFSGWIAPDVRFVAFDVVDKEAITAPGTPWQVIFEEQPCEPRFGLDTWPAGDDDDHLRAGGTSWGLNSAHAARHTYQAPFRFRFAVDDLIGERP